MGSNQRASGPDAESDRFRRRTIGPAVARDSGAVPGSGAVSWDNVASPTVGVDLVACTDSAVMPRFTDRIQYPQSVNIAELVSSVSIQANCQVAE
ncbi:MAG TPA: hypothetical protein VKB75_00135 [Jatrophihabitans sp.]|nr:hypothetical protein [Jatrophihabitans sp.]